MTYIRRSASRKAGELLQKMEKAKGGGNRTITDQVATSSGHKTLTQLGISKQPSSDLQKLAAVEVGNSRIWEGLRREAAFVA